MGTYARVHSSVWLAVYSEEIAVCGMNTKLDWTVRFNRSNTICLIDGLNSSLSDYEDKSDKNSQK